MFLITSRALETDWLSLVSLTDVVQVTFGAGLPLAEQLTMTSLPSITSIGEKKVLTICGGTEKTSPCVLEDIQSFSYIQITVFKLF